VAKSIRWNASGAIRIVEQGATEGARIVMDGVLEESQKQVPKDTGELADSAEMNINKQSISLRYTANHALEQHENLHYRHKPGQKAKYLEDPFNEIARSIGGRRIAIELDKRLRKG
jgi:hypothetical protein